MPTAMMMTRPIINSCTNGETPISTSPLRMTPMISTPRMVPRIVPSPPDSDEPPTMVAAITSSSSPRPVRPAWPLGKKGEAEDAGERGQRAHQDERRDFHRVDVDARHPRRLGAAADRENPKAEIGVGQNHPGDGGDGAKNTSCIGTTPNR